MQIFKLIEFPAKNMRNNTPRLLEALRTRKRERTMIFEALRIYSNLPQNVHDLPEYLFITHIKKWPIDLSKNLIKIIQNRSQLVL